ncbi:MAG: arylsulfatase [Deltaproteobacteria bacterium]|nr:arylsulfatase [Deltaproteobacteria bacterium]
MLNVLYFIASFFIATAYAVAAPNIVLIIADDLGYADVSYNGGDIQTPNIDFLAQNGIELENFYVEPVCTQTRAALLSGRYPFRYDLDFRVIKPDTDAALPVDELIFPEALKAIGYYTALIGKWHLGSYRESYLPTSRGFDYHYGNYCGWVDYYSHVRKRHFKQSKNSKTEWFRNNQMVRECGYTTELLTSEAIETISSHNSKTPLFLQVAYTAPHAPLKAPPSYLKRVSYIENNTRRELAAVVTALDDGVGEIIRALEENKMLQDTLLIFISDNGGKIEHGSNNGPYRGEKKDFYEGGVKVPAVIYWQNKFDHRNITENLHVVDLYPTILKLASAPNINQKMLDGIDFSEILLNPSATLGREYLFYGNTQKSAAIRTKKFKLVHDYNTDQVTLYNLETDPTESIDLSEQYPDFTDKLFEKLTEYIPTLPESAEVRADK